MKYLFKNKLFIFLTTLYITGICAGMIIAVKNITTYNLLPKEEFSVQHFLQTFAINFWYLFIIYLVGYSYIGIIINPIIIFIRGLIFGIIMYVCMKIGVRYLFLYLSLEIIFIFPANIILNYCSCSLSLTNIKRMRTINIKSYNLIMFIITIVIIIYSIIVSIN